MNKKATLSLKVTIELLVAVVCIVLLVYFGVLIFKTFIPGENFKTAKKNLELISQKIDYLQSKDYSENFIRVLVLGPENWYLKSYYIKEKAPPEGECVGRFKSCLCICNFEDCSDQKICKGFKEKISINEKAIQRIGNPTPSAGIINQEIINQIDVDYITIYNPPLELEILKPENQIIIQDAGLKKSIYLGKILNFKNGQIFQFNNDKKSCYLELIDSDFKYKNFKMLLDEKDRYQKPLLNVKINDNWEDYTPYIMEEDKFDVYICMSKLREKLKTLSLNYDGRSIPVEFSGSNILAEINYVYYKYDLYNKKLLSSVERDGRYIESKEPEILEAFISLISSEGNQIDCNGKKINYRFKVLYEYYHYPTILIYLNKPFKMQDVSGYDKYYFGILFEDVYSVIPAEYFLDDKKSGQWHILSDYFSNGWFLNEIDSKNPGELPDYQEMKDLKNIRDFMIEKCKLKTEKSLKK